MIRQQGFSLIELAIVLVIVTLLVGGLAMPLAAQIQASRIAETRKIMEEARESIIGYTMTHFCQCVYSGLGNSGVPTAASTCAGGCQSPNPSPHFTTLQRHYLPCPDTDFDGIENRTAGTCDSSQGLFPFVELGTGNQDAWGNHLHYSVTPEYANMVVGFGLTNPSPADKQICNTNGCGVGTLVASAIPAVLVSYGPNGWGARNVNSNTLSNPTSLDETENTDNDTFYVSRIPTDANAAAGEFDDLVVWISTPTLIDRVCLGRCP